MDEIIDAVLNHVKQGIIRTYNRHDYEKEKQQALESWELKLKNIIAEKEGIVVSDHEYVANYNQGDGLNKFKNV